MSIEEKPARDLTNFHLLRRNNALAESKEIAVVPVRTQDGAPEGCTGGGASMRVVLGGWLARSLAHIEMAPSWCGIIVRAKSTLGSPLK